MMEQTDDARTWDQRYQEGNHPWNAGRPEPRLTELIGELDIASGMALDLGCGYGDNAFWLGREGFEVLGVDIAPTAAGRARRSALKAGLRNVHFAAASVVESLPVPPETVALALDRGCYHSLTASQRPVMARCVAEAMKDGGWWLLLCGNIDQPRSAEEQGPPQLTARDIIESTEPVFELHRLERTRFSGNDGRPTHLAWRAILRRRGHADA